MACWAENENAFLVLPYYFFVLISCWLHILANNSWGSVMWRIVDWIIFIWRRGINTRLFRFAVCSINWAFSESFQSVYILEASLISKKSKHHLFTFTITQLRCDSGHSFYWKQCVECGSVKYSSVFFFFDALDKILKTHFEFVYHSDTEIAPGPVSSLLQVCPKLASGANSGPTSPDQIIFAIGWKCKPF